MSKPYNGTDSFQRGPRPTEHNETDPPYQKQVVDEQLVQIDGKTCVVNDITRSSCGLPPTTGGIDTGKVQQAPAATE